MCACMSVFLSVHEKKREREDECVPNREWEMKRSAAEGIEQWEDRGSTGRKTAVGSLLRKEKKEQLSFISQM